MQISRGDIYYAYLDNGIGSEQSGYYGLRKSEVFGLKWDAIDFESNTISIKHVVVKNRTVVAKDSTKSYSSRRTFEILPEVIHPLPFLCACLMGASPFCKSYIKPNL